MFTSASLRVMRRVTWASLSAAVEALRRWLRGTLTISSSGYGPRALLTMCVTGAGAATAEAPSTPSSTTFLVPS